MNEVNGVPIKSTSMVKLTPHLFISTLKLFNAIPVKTMRKRKPTHELLQNSIYKGYIISPRIVANYSVLEIEEIMNIANNIIGISGAQANASFHKSWEKVRDAPLFQLVLEQIVHYITTYGYERLGIYDKNTVYLPAEELNVPDLTKDIPLPVINGLTKAEIKEKLMVILNSGMALKSLDDVIVVAEYLKLTNDEVNQIKNKEVRCRLYDEMNFIPTDPIEFLRLMIFKTTGDSLLIINRTTIEKIKETELNLRYDFINYDTMYNGKGQRRLAEIFQRFKPLFLAIKTSGDMSDIINSIGHLSKKYHRPLTLNIMNNVTGFLKQKEGSLDTLAMAVLKSELDSANIWRKIRLLGALNHRIHRGEGITYKIRNGKSYTTELKFDNIRGAMEVYDVVAKSLISNMTHLKGKKVYVPDNIEYALPATEKQFTGNLPSGSYIECNDMVFGVWWQNVKGHRIDLDLACQSMRQGKIGWDARYRDESRGIMFSGDVTDAPSPKGASELFRFQSTNPKDDVMLLTLNYYNHEENLPVPFKIVVGDTLPVGFGNNYMLDPNEIVASALTQIKDKEKALGIVIVKDGICRFYFNETGLSNKISSRTDNITKLARDYMVKSATNNLTLTGLLQAAGAIFVDKVDKDVIDLSPTSVTKDTFISLLLGNK